MLKTQEFQTVYNNGYAESKVPGAYALTSKHVDVLTSLMPKHAEFISDIAEVLMTGNYKSPACLLAHFATLIHMQSEGLYAEYKLDGIDASEIKFSFVSHLTSQNLSRYETKEQQMLRAFLRFKMNDVIYSKVQHLLASKYGLTLITMGNCGCCILPLGQVQQLLSNAKFIAENDHRSHFDAEGIKTQLIEVSDIFKQIDVDFTMSDIRAMTLLEKLIAKLAKVDLNLPTTLYAVV